MELRSSVNIRHWSHRPQLRRPPLWIFPSCLHPIRSGSLAATVTRLETSLVFLPCRFHVVSPLETCRLDSNSSAVHLMKRVSCGLRMHTNRRTRGANGIRSCDEVLIIFSANERAPRTS